MFDLYARVNFDEVKRTGVGVHQEFDRPCVGVSRCFAKRQRGAANILTLRIVEVGCRRPLHDFLVAPLHGAIAFEEVHECAVVITEDLHFDVACSFHEFLEVHLTVAECGFRFAPGRVELLGQVVFRKDPTHTAAAAAPARLEHQRVADFLRLGDCVVEVRRERFRSRHDRHVGFFGDVTCTNLVAQGAHRIRARANKDQACLTTGIREVRVFGQESVAGMHGVGSRLVGNPEHFFDVEVGRDGLARFPDSVALVSLEPMQSEAVLFGIHRYGLYAELGAGAHDANRDLAAVGHQEAPDLVRFWFRHWPCSSRYRRAQYSVAPRPDESIADRDPGLSSRAWWAPSAAGSALGPTAVGR